MEENCLEEGTGKRGGRHRLERVMTRVEVTKEWKGRVGRRWREEDRGGDEEKNGVDIGEGYEGHLVDRVDG